jgi:hypothetical protein
VSRRGGMLPIVVWGAVASMPQNGTLPCLTGQRARARVVHRPDGDAPGDKVMHDLVVAIFALASGFTASGIVANIYRLVTKKKKSDLGRVAYVAVMVFAGPNVLFENAAKSWREKSCTATAFWLAAALCGYWSLAIGLLVIQLGLALKGL